jgi:hypothetical protein
MDEIRKQIQEAFERALEPIRGKPQPIDVDELYAECLKSLERE